MILLAVAVVIGLAAGRLREPLGARGYRPQFARIGLLGIGAAGNLLAYLLSGSSATVVLALSLATLLAFVAANNHVTGVVVIGAGLFLNLVALVLNNGMPVRPSALTAAGVVEQSELDTIEFSGPRHLETGSDRFAVLGDVLPVGFPIGREVISFGDLIVVFGAADAVRELARRRQSRWSAADVDAYRANDRLPGLAVASPSAPDTIEVVDLSSPMPTPTPATDDFAAPSSELDSRRPPLARRRPLVAISQE